MFVRSTKTRVFACWLLVCSSALYGCSDRIDQAHPASTVRVAPAGEDDLAPHVIARVDGTPILDSQIAELVHASDHQLSPRKALDILIRTELLANEATRRGFHTSFEALEARSTELVHAFFRDKIVEPITADTLDTAYLHEFYQKSLPHFVHGPKRRVVHFLAHTGKNNLGSDLAFNLATQVAKHTRKVKNEEAFKTVAKTVVDEKYRGKTRVESLRPFAADDDGFVAPFVKAAFNIAAVGQTSPPIKTGFGWHVIYFAEKIPPKNVPFAEAKSELRQKLLPRKRAAEAGALFKSIYDKSDIFIYEDAPGHQAPKP